MHFLIVRRGNDEKFAFLQEAFASHPVEILWDRRVGERRQQAAVPPREQRSGIDRRHPVPDTWAELDFILAQPTRAETSSAP